MRYRRRHLLLLALACTAPQSCMPAAHKAYHPVPCSIEEKSKNHPYELAYLEFDEQGDPWEDPRNTDDGQLDRAIKMIDRVNGSTGDERGDPEGALFVTFVHGWRNNAAPGNHNLENFKLMLELLAMDEERVAAAEIRPPRPVGGIYVAWRGDSLSARSKLVNWLDVFTFWSRNATALRLASRPPVTQSLLILMKEIQGNPHARSIVVGHSMGALILERAVSQAFVGVINEVKYRPTCPKYQECPDVCKEETCPTCECPEELQPGRFKPPADLFVFVNSAASAIQAKHLVEVLKDQLIMSTSDRGETPFLISVTAENDRATKLLFPFAMSFESEGQRFRKEPDLDQRALVLRTAGHTDFLFSHKRLEYQKDVACQGTSRPFPLRISRCVAEERDGSRIVFTIGGEDKEGTATRKVQRKFALERKPGFNTSPYWIFQVPSDVIDGHSDFFRPVFTDFLRGVITVTDAIDPEKPRSYEAEVKEAGAGDGN